MTGAARPPTGPPVASRLETRVLAGCLAITLAIVAFAALTAEVREGDIFAMDKVLLLAFRHPAHLGAAIGPRWVQEAARDITALGGFTVLTLIAVVAAAMLAIRGRRREAWIFAAMVVFAQAASEAIKHLVARPRPEVVPHLDLVYSSSFPSGHALMSPVVYLTLAAILAAGERRTAAKVLILTLAPLLVLAIGVSRVYLGVHWPTDVLGGWALGSAIALLEIVLMSRYLARDGRP